MKKLVLIVVLTVSLGLMGGICMDQASAFFGGFGKGFWGGGGCGYAAPYNYGITPYWAYGPGCGPVYPGCAMKKKAGKAKAAPAAPKPAPKKK